VDRVDYTKGILERFRGIERFLEMIPRINGDFRSCKLARQAGPLSRDISNSWTKVTAEADRINARFQSGKWKPILLLRKHHSHQGDCTILSRGIIVHGHFNCTTG